MNEALKKPGVPAKKIMSKVNAACFKMYECIQSPSALFVEFMF